LTKGANVEVQMLLGDSKEKQRRCRPTEPFRHLGQVTTLQTNGVMMRGDRDLPLDRRPYSDEAILRFWETALDRLKAYIESSPKVDGRHPSDQVFCDEERQSTR
jgi:hypothetical protein